MAKGKDSHAEMAHARQSEGINVIFDRNSPASSCSPASRSRSSERSSGSGRYKGRASHRGRYRSSSSSSSSSRSSSRPRSRSHPRCHRRSSRCRCDNHSRYGRGRYRSHSRSPSRCSRYRSSTKTYRSPSRSRSSGSVSLSLNDKRELIKAARDNALKILGVEKLELPESVKPILSVESKRVSPEPGTWVRQDHEKTLSQSGEVEPEMSSPKMSPNRKIITFSINNLVVKPSVAAPSSAKVTPRVDIYESRKPYGHWVPVKTGKISKARKHSMSH